RPGRELALAVFPLSITDTGGVSGVSRHEARIVSVLCVCVYIYIRALVCSLALLASSTTTTTARTRTTATRGAKHSWPGDSRTHGRALKPREENCARFPGTGIRDERRRKRRQRKEETASSSWT
ncbi:hypothetical protein ALC62_12808, partial [Cyphomyrmex costatus]